jgi:hypothetical protein
MFYVRSARWVTLFFDEVILNRFHLGQIKRSAAVFGNSE